MAGRKKTGTMFLVLIIVFLLLVSGCGIRQDSAEDDSVPETAIEETEEEVTEEMPEEEVTEEVPEEEVINHATGFYVGHADAHSIEMEMTDSDYEYMVFRLTPEVQQIMDQENPPPNAPMEIEYIYTEHGQTEIVKLTIIE